MKKTIDLLAIGEVLVGFYAQADGTNCQDISGDVFNTLQAASRLGLKTALVSAVYAVAQVV